MIYLVENIINKKKYVGYTKHDLEWRKKTHYKRIKNPTTHFHRALRKYGKENFIWKVIDKTLDISKENYYITRYNTITEGYNMTQGGFGGDTISMKTDKEKKNQGAKKGNIPWNKGKSMKELGYTFSNRTTRPPFTDEQKKAHSDLVKTEKYYNGIKNRKITGNQYQVKRLSDGKIWESQKECLEELNISGYIFRKNLGKEFIKVVNGQNKL